MLIKLPLVQSTWQLFSFVSWGGVITQLPAGLARTGEHNGSGTAEFVDPASATEAKLSGV